jgi:phage-related tail protein
MLQMKKMLRENMIKLTVYNSEFTENLSRISGDLSKAILQNSESQIQSAVTEIEKLYDTASEVAKRVDDVLSGMFAGYEEEADEVVDIFSELQKAIQSFRDSFVDIGSEVADKLIAGISDGLKEQELFEVIKNYIRENIIKASVYADYASELAEIGKSITAGIVDKSGSELENAKNKISKIYREMTESMQAIDEMLGDIFGKSTVEAVEETAEEVVDNLSKLENAINSFKESIADVGADIASNLINGLTNGLSQSDFLTNMKDWLRKMLLQAVVYTETMKNEIEAIGKAISAGISGGFTDTSLHEIRRDLSYIFEQANKSVGKIDEVLGGVFGYANGTNNATRGLHIVGEAGPELVNFRGGEQVLNNRNTQKALASVDGGNTFNVVFNNTQDTTAYAMMSQLRQYNREMAINVVL